MAKEEKKNVVETRPPSGSKDPLAGGERLYNVNNDSNAKAYKADRSELDAPPVQKKNVVVDQTATPGQPPKPVHKTKNASQKDQAKVAKDRVEPGTKKK